MLERRKEQRLAIALSGKIGFGRHRFRLSCWIANISSSGARLTLRGEADLPPAFTLTVISRAQVEYPVRARWRQGDAIGVEIAPLHDSPAGVREPRGSPGAA
ncbi:MAG TPA: PilZ domain-containing protein [Xanthobacteraceae bacterium]|jgi:hypothetical protein